MEELGGGIGTAELGEHLKHSIEMGQPRAKSIDKLVEHELAFDQMIFTVGDFLGEHVEELSLHAAEGLRCLTARPGQFRIRVLPLLQFVSTLLVHRNLLLNQLLQQPILLLLADNQLPQQIDRSAFVRRLS